MPPGQQALTPWATLQDAKCQILVGILQNSEFCWKLLQFRPETCSAILILFIVPRLEAMYLDFRCDIGISWSQPEF